LLQYVLDDSPIIEAWQSRTPGNAQCQAAGKETPHPIPCASKRGEHPQPCPIFIYSRGFPVHMVQRASTHTIKGKNLAVCVKAETCSPLTRCSFIAPYKLAWVCHNDLCFLVALYNEHKTGYL